MKWLILITALVGLGLGYLARRYLWPASRLGLVGNLVAGAAGATAGGLAIGKRTPLPGGHVGNQIVSAVIVAAVALFLLNFMFPKRAAPDPEPDERATDEPRA
jgi:uncharacterized membrane protein YeaQ/YmgE (transglycosylase-associated protein family)